MKIAFTTKGAAWDSLMDARFGRTEMILIYNEETHELTPHENKEAEHGAGPQAAQLLFTLKPDVLITGNGPGGNAAKVLQQSTIQIYTGAGDMTVKQALEAFKQNALTRFV